MPSSLKVIPREIEYSQRYFADCTLAAIVIDQASLPTEGQVCPRGVVLSEYYILVVLMPVLIIASVVGF